MEATAKALTERLMASLGLPEQRKDALTYGMVTLFVTLLDLGAVILAGWLAGALRLTLIVALTSAFFRALTGGAHFESPWTCAVASGLIAAGLGRAAAALQRYPVGPVMASLSAAGVAAWTFSAFAPVASPAKPLSQVHKLRLRRLARLALAAWVLAAAALRFQAGGVVTASALGLLWQAGTLTPGGARLYRSIDGQVAVRKDRLAKGWKQ